MYIATTQAGQQYLPLNQWFWQLERSGLRL